MLCHWLSVSDSFTKVWTQQGMFQWKCEVLGRWLVGVCCCCHWCNMPSAIHCLSFVLCFFCQWLPWRCRTDSGITICSRMSVPRGYLDSNWSFGDLLVSQCQSVSACQCQNLLSLSVSVSLHALLCQSALHWDRLIHRFWPSSSSTSAPLLVRPLFDHVRLAPHWHVAIKAWRDGGSASPFCLGRCHHHHEILPFWIQPMWWVAGPQPEQWGQLHQTDQATWRFLVGWVRFNSADSDWFKW